MSQPEGTQTNPPAPSGSAVTPLSDSYIAWTQHVRLDGEIRLLNDNARDHLPEVKKLLELVDKSLIVPEWLADNKSLQYDPHCNRMKCFRSYIRGLSRGLSLSKYTKDKDDHDLSIEVEECLPFLLHIRRHADALQTYSLGLDPVEADRRHPVDTLASLVWDFQLDGAIIYRTERQLQIPRISTNHSRFTQPDACAFILMPDSPGVVASADLKPALSCFPRSLSSSPECRFIPHWVTEFKPHHSEPASRRQVVKGLVSALYQRRALGFPNHFVFGTAHHSRTCLEVLAATWVPSDDPARLRAHSAQEASTESAVPPVDQANSSSGDSLQGGDVAGGGPRTDKRVDSNTKLTIQDIKKYNKIVVYTIAKYSMLDIEPLLELYLLMRQTRILAQQYQEEIRKDGPDRIDQLSYGAKDFYEWAPPPSPKSDRGRPSKRQRTDDQSNELGSMTEEIEDMMSVDQDDGFDESVESGSEELHSLSGAAHTHTWVKVSRVSFLFS
ncbi:hypothetical protein V565_002400 [Rhizoctonia solani 123E]|uniref:Uncharacterized protein n=1 Tax=Rhizoctonia solani 123E TaxID=1423351 RepID=A0A074S884_9AGAM|nr:hypothetical protein V565_002400 [Rhizoctonia solani 123E]